MSEFGERNSNYRHGGKGTKLYEVWCSMNRRCSSEKDKNYQRYGGRGISVCQEWRNDYAKFRDWSLKNGYKEGLTIDRIDNDGNYCPRNCRWTNRKVQANNQGNTIRIEYMGETRTLHGWADCLNINPCTLYARLFVLNWPLEKSFGEPVDHFKYRRKNKR